MTAAAVSRVLDRGCGAGRPRRGGCVRSRRRTRARSAVRRDAGRARAGRAAAVAGRRPGGAGVPRLAARAVLWPVVKTTDVLEHYRLIDWGRRADHRRRPGGRAPGAALLDQLHADGRRALLLPAAARSGQRDLTRVPDRGARRHDRPARLARSRPARAVAAATWNRRNDRLFAGVGPNSVADLAAAGATSRATRRTTSAPSCAGRASCRAAHRQAHSDVQHRNYRSNDVAGPSVADVYGLPPAECALRGLPAGCVDEAQLPGFNTGMRLARVGGGALLDLREPARDGSGVSIAIDGTYAHGLAADPSRHGVLSAETVVAHGRQRSPAPAARARRDGRALRRRRRCRSRSWSCRRARRHAWLPRRALPGRQRPGRHGGIPLVHLPPLDATLFVDVGTVGGPRFSHMDWDRWFPSFGTGLRYHRRRAPLGSPALDGIQFAYAPDGGLRSCC